MGRKERNISLVCIIHYGLIYMYTVIHRIIIHIISLINIFFYLSNTRIFYIIAAYQFYLVIIKVVREREKRRERGRKRERKREREKGREIKLLWEIDEKNWDRGEKDR